MRFLSKAWFILLSFVIGIAGISFGADCETDLVSKKFLYSPIDQEGLTSSMLGKWTEESGGSWTFAQQSLSISLDSNRYYKGLPDLINLSTQVHAKPTDRLKLQQEFVDSFLSNAYKRDVRILSIYVHVPSLTEGQMLWLDRLNRFNLTHQSDKIYLRIPHSPVASTLQSILPASVGAEPKKIDAIIKQIVALQSVLGGISITDTAQVRAMAQDPCYGRTGAEFLDGYRMDDLMKGVKTSCYTAGTLKYMLRARIGIYDSNYFDDITLDFSSRQVQLVLAANLGMILDLIKVSYPNIPIYDIVFSYQPSDGESMIINGSTGVKRATLAKTPWAIQRTLGARFDEYRFSFSGAPFGIAERSEFTKRYKYYKKFVKIWQYMNRTLSRTAKLKGAAHVSLYSHPNLEILFHGIIDYYSYLKTSEIDLIHSSYMPPAPPFADSMNISDQLSFTASTAKRVGAIWRLDYSWPTVDWKVSGSNWSPSLHPHHINIDFNSDGIVDDTIIDLQAWNVGYLHSNGYTSGNMNAETFYSQAIAASRLGACGMNYSNWPTHWFTDSSLFRDNLVGSRWSSLIGSRTIPRRASQRLDSSWKSQSTDSNNAVAIYVNTAARLYCEEKNQSPCNYRTYSRMAAHARINSSGKHVEFITSSNIFQDSTILSKYSKIYMFDEIAKPTGVALTAWTADGISTKVDLYLGRVSSRIIRENKNMNADTPSSSPVD